MADFTDIAKYFRRGDTAGPVFAVSLELAGLDQPDGAEMQPEQVRATEADRRGSKWKRDDDDIWGASFAIEYVDAAGTASRRRISCRTCATGPRGERILRAFCHERQALRTFRLDRITSIIDLDGVVHEPRAFFETEMRVEFEAPPAAPTDTPKQKRGRLRKSLFDSEMVADGIRALIALGRSDGHLTDAEIDIVLRYAAGKADMRGMRATADDLDTIPARAKRHHSDHAELIACLDRIAREPPQERRLFLRSAIALMDADGLQHPSEFDMLIRVEDHLLPRV